MSWYNRHFEELFQNKLKVGKVLLVYGARRVGKTSLIRKCLQNTQLNFFEGTGDDIQLRDLLASQRASTIVSAFKNYDLVFIDEAQRIPEIGWGLKILVDSLPDLRIVVSGSSSFELSGQVSEPLTGRQTVMNLFTLSLLEIEKQFGGMHIIQQLENYLLYGMYPETLTAESSDEKKEYLVTLRNSYLFKDILELENVRNPSKLSDLLKLLAFQIGNEVSLNELSNSLGIAKQTVERYLDLLEKTFIIKKMSGFSNNLRKEVTKTHRYYFYDNGVRNAIISNFNTPDTRMDMGMLWENFCVMERLKTQEYQQLYTNNYFWRTYDQQEVDLVEERDGKLHGFEFKWNKNKVAKAPRAWLNTYENATFDCVNANNFLEFLI